MYPASSSRLPAHSYHLTWLIVVFCAANKTLCGCECTKPIQRGQHKWSGCLFGLWNPILAMISTVIVVLDAHFRCRCIYEIEFKRRYKGALPRICLEKSVDTSYAANERHSVNTFGRLSVHFISTSCRTWNQNSCRYRTPTSAQQHAPLKQSTNLMGIFRVEEAGRCRVLCACAAAVNNVSNSKLLSFQVCLSLPFASHSSIGATVFVQRRTDINVPWFPYEFIIQYVGLSSPMAQCTPIGHWYATLHSDKVITKWKFIN